VITEDALRDLMADDSPLPSLSPALVRRRARAIRRGRRAGMVAVVALVVPSTAIGLSRLPLWQGRTPGSNLPAAFAGDGRPLPRLADGHVSLALPGMTAWATSDEECVSNVPNSDIGGWCHTDSPEEGDTFTIGGGTTFGVVVEPIVRAELSDGQRTVTAVVVGFAAHPQWRTFSALTTWSTSDMNNVGLRGWDAAGKLVVQVGCPGGCPAVPQQVPDPLNARVPAAKSAVPSAG
jgi:hypothetical protein